MKTDRIFVLLLVVMLSIPGCTSDDSTDVQCDPEVNICGTVTIIEVTVENTSSDDKVTSVLVSGKAADNTGSFGFTIDKVSYRSTCERNGDQVTVTFVDLTDNTALEPGDQFQFIAELSNCSAGQDESLTFIIIVEGGGQSLENLEVSSTQSGSSLR